MIHAVLTCKNHPNLRWSCKSIAVNTLEEGVTGVYNGCRNIFFCGEITDPPSLYADQSGVETNPAAECTCPSKDLMIAPETKLIKG